MVRSAALALGCVLACGGSSFETADAGSGNTGPGAPAADAGTPDAGVAALTGISLSQTDIRIPKGARTAFAVTASYNDGSHADVSEQCHVSISNGEIATLQQGPGAQVQVFARDEGSAVITVTYGQFTQTANLTVTDH